MIIRKINQYIANCGRKFSVKSKCLAHEKNCTCWNNPANKTCMTCGYGHREFIEGKPIVANKKNMPTIIFVGWSCSNSKFQEKHFKPTLHDKTGTLCFKCKCWRDTEDMLSKISK